MGKPDRNETPKSTLNTSRRLDTDPDPMHPASGTHTGYLIPARPTMAPLYQATITSGRAGPYQETRQRKRNLWSIQAMGSATSGIICAEKPGSRKRRVPRPDTVARLNSTRARDQRRQGIRVPQSGDTSPGCGLRSVSQRLSVFQVLGLFFEKTPQSRAAGCGRNHPGILRKTEESVDEIPLAKTAHPYEIRAGRRIIHGNGRIQPIA